MITEKELKIDEHEAINKYKEYLAQGVRNPKIIPIVRKIIYQEEGHIKFLNKIEKMKIVWFLQIKKHARWKGVIKLARKKLARKISNSIMWVLGTLITLAIAGTFISGGFMNTFLGVLPLIIHQIVGWFMIALVIIGALVWIIKKLK